MSDETQTQTPTTTHYQQLAAQLDAAMKAVLAEVPKFEMPQRSKKSKVVAHLWVPPEFLADACNVVQSTDLGLEKVLDPADVQNVLQFAEAFRSLVKTVQALAAGLDFTIKVQYARVANNALDAYAIVKRLGRDGTDGTLQRHTETMSRSLGRKTPRPRANKTPAPPAPAPGQER